MQRDLPPASSGSSRGAWPRALRSAAFVVLPISLSACEWFTDFKRQPMVTTWEQDSILGVRGAPQGSVPRSGTALAQFQVSYQPLPAVIDSIGAATTNPTPISDSSLANGHVYYQHNCAVCHGDTGAGNGSATRYGMAGISLLMDVSKGRSDGYLFGVMRNGRGLMPAYNRIEEADRWDVVNYVRALQGLAGGAEFATGPVALPGVAGDKVPGATRIGPNRAVPHVPPTLIGTPGATRPAAEQHDNASSPGAASPAQPGGHE